MSTGKILFCNKVNSQSFKLIEIILNRGSNCLASEDIFNVFTIYDNKYSAGK